jgi:hypothetical protein
MNISINILILARKSSGWWVIGERKGTSVPFRSAPAQNALPVPVRIPTRSEGSSSSHCQMELSSWWPVVLMQFRSRGRLRVTRRMCGEGKERVASCGFGGAVVKGIFG